MWGRTCFALYVAAQQVSRYTTYQIPKFIVFRDVLCVTAPVHCPDLSFFSIMLGGSMVVVNLLGGPSGLPKCGFRDASSACDFRGERSCFQRGASVRYCVAAKPHGHRGPSGTTGHAHSAKNRPRPEVRRRPAQATAWAERQRDSVDRSHLPLYIDSGADCGAPPWTPRSVFHENNVRLRPLWPDAPGRPRQHPAAS